MGYPVRFNRLEFAGALGDLGTLLPLAIGMTLINGLNPAGLFLAVGIFYVISGLYLGVTSPVQPMKVIGAYAVATAMSAQQILASGLMMSVLLLILGATGAITLIGRYTPKAVVRGVQLATGTLLMAQGIKFMIGTAKLQILRQVAEPYLVIQHLGPLPIGIVIGSVGFILTLLFLENRKLPAGLIVVGLGLLVGLGLGTREGLSGLRLGLQLPELLPLGLPGQIDFTFAFLALVLPQIPMTIGNAVIADVDLSRQYFGEHSNRVTERALCFLMALGNFISFALGGMPLCTGAGGLAAHFRFGARTAGSNFMIGALFCLLALVAGEHILALLYLLPMAILGVLLLFAGSQLALTILDIHARKDLFVVLAMLVITLVTNLAIAFGVGFVLAYALKSDRLQI
jgi:SulP family sulfate permease